MDSLRRPVPWNQVLLNGVLLDASELKTPPRQTPAVGQFEFFDRDTIRKNSNWPACPNSRKRTYRQHGLHWPKNLFKLHARLIPCEGLHLTRVEGPPSGTG